MSNVYVISDLHLSHKNMAIFRGFKNVEEHDQYIIDKWNSVVNKKDTVWILGDITMEKTSPYHILNLLYGYKKVVLGNHDQPQHTKELLNYVNSVAGMVNYKKFLLTHAPVHPTELDGTSLKNIHGHIHSKIINDDRYINVCCEQVDYTPQLISKFY